MAAVLVEPALIPKGVVALKLDIGNDAYHAECIEQAVVKENFAVLAKWLSDSNPRVASAE